MQDVENKNFNVIDGQQRLATLSLISLAIIKRLNDLVESKQEDDENTERIEKLKEQYIGKRDAVSLRYSNKLQQCPDGNTAFRAGPGAKPTRTKKE